MKMQWAECVRFAWWALSRDKFKAFLTMLGVVIGSAGIVLVVTIASVGKSYIVAQVEGIGANLVYATLDRTGRVLPQDELSREDLAAARTLPGVVAAAGTYDLPAEFYVGTRLLHARLVGATEDFQKIRNLRITSGRYFDAEDFASRDKACLVTDRIAETAFRPDTVIGSTMRLNQFRCTIIGTFRESVPTFGQSEIQDQTVLVAYPLIRVINGSDYFQVIYVQAASSAEVPRVTEEFRALVRKRHRPGAQYSVENLSSLLSTAQTVSVAMTGVLLAVALITLTTGGVGIMNIMLVNVSQRTREIGIRMAIGARQSDIRLQFLLEAVFISAGGALVGIALAVALIGAVGSIGLAPIEVSRIAVVFSLMVSTGTGVLFGYRPADAAAKLNPIDALRTEA